ncbi:M1 family metallopeptidase [Flavicella sediminum]|uniref:M1 family metallopeptidase n=1 Tax=Flavicella sediminum TaxID=2585141 RepID=UPI00111DC127|nr:M1 family metallopeptidase [Flavicella sediminum]
MKQAFFFFILFFSILISNAQEKNVFTQQDSLRGSITEERIWWDLKHYDLSIQVNIQDKFISGSNCIRYEVLRENRWMQIDLQAPMLITKVVQKGKVLKVRQVGNAHYIYLNNRQRKGKVDSLTVYFEGHPPNTKTPPWDAGFTWATDSKGNDFIATSCQSFGASVWWPNKDHLYDEPDEGVTERYTVPENLVAVGNGKLLSRKKDSLKKTTTYIWQVKNPINNYSVNLNIGNYQHFSEVFLGENGDLTCDYYVLEEHIEKAKSQFKEVKKTLAAFEFWFGPYPFYQDGYKLVEVPYLGMEHQSSVTYGNGFKNGYLGGDLSKTGWGLKFDFIIVHETGHEWFGNNISNKDIADMWIHESFTNYSESLFLDYHFGTKAANEYVIGLRKRILNDKPIIGHYHVNKEGSGDMYFKGNNMLHMIRQLVANDEKWRTILRGLNKTFYHQTVTTNQIETYLSAQSGFDLSTVFQQYIRTVHVPVLEYKQTVNKIEYRFSNAVENFKLPLKIFLNKEPVWIYPSAEWKDISLTDVSSTFEIDPNFYIEVKKVN